MEMPRTKKIAYGGVFIAAIALVTAYIKVPIPFAGYMHLGDGLIFAVAMVLGPWGALVAGLGSALADVLAGFPIYAPASFVIKGAMALIAAYMIKEKNTIDFKENTNEKGAKVYAKGSTKKWLLKVFFAALIGEIIMIAGYFLYDMILTNFKTALLSIPFNALQGVLGIILAMILVPAIRSIMKK